MLYSQLKTEATSAQKAGDKRTLEALRLLLSELSYAKVESKTDDLPDEVVIRVLGKEAKKRKDSIEIYEKVGETVRADQEKFELTMIEKYLPTLMNEADVEAEVIKIAAETGLTGGRLMGAVMGKLRGKADGAVINKIVMAKFS